MADNYNQMIMDGDGFDAYSPYKSECSQCKHFHVVDYNCNAFPKGIPTHYLDGSKIHNQVDPGQIGTTVLTT